MQLFPHGLYFKSMVQIFPDGNDGNGFPRERRIHFFPGLTEKIRLPGSDFADEILLLTS